MSLTSGDGASGGDVSLREHLEFRLDALEGQIDRRMLAAQEAVRKAEEANDRRFDGVNEFRSALNDMVSHLMPRAESEQRHALTAEKLGVLDNRLTRIEGAGMGVKGTWLAFVALIATGAAVISAVLAIAR